MTMAGPKTPQPENAVLFHHPDAVDINRDAIMGRHSAGDEFFRGFVKHSGVDHFYNQSMTPEDDQDFIDRIKAFGVDAPVCTSVPIGQMGHISDAPKTLMLPSPGLDMYAWRRRVNANARSYSLVGLNHTISSDTVMDDLAALLTAPVQPWDAVICTSNAAKTAMGRLLDNWANYLGSRSGGGRFKAQVQMPVIPLGVDCDKYAPTPQTAEARTTIRRGLGIGDDDVVVLYFGRLSFHAKAHPVAMYLSLEEAAKRTGKRIHLLQAGRFPNAGVEKEFRDGAMRYCPSVNALFLDSRDQGVSDRVWFAADIFTSLSDNIQESSGLTPIEAMAAGLPVVVSDWSGYRDTVRNGVDGILVPTWLPLPDSGTDLSLRMEDSLSSEDKDRTYSQYCGTVSQSTAVDVAAAADAFTALVNDPDLRRKFGDAGRARAKSDYGWHVIVRSYQDLWRELANIRNRTVEVAPLVQGRPAFPLREDPFALFQNYPSGTINGDVIASLSDTAGADFKSRLSEMRVMMMNEFATDAMLSEESILSVGQNLADTGPCSVIRLAEPLPDGVRYRLPRTLAWLAKLGIITLKGPTATSIVSDHGPAPAKSEAQKQVELGMTERARGAIEAAAEHFEKAIISDPNHVEANFQFGEILATARKLPEACDCLRRAIDNDPDHIAARRSLAKALFLSGNEQAALETLEGAAEQFPEDVETLYLLGAGYRRAGAANKAISYLQTALKLNPKRSDALTHLALARKSLGRTNAAQEAADLAIEHDPSNVFARATYLSLKAESQGRKNIAHSKEAKRVAIHINRRFHFPLLRPLFEALSVDHWPLITGDGRELIEFDPDVVVVCDTHADVLRKSLPNAVFVQTRNSMALKNYFSNRPNSADFICAPSDLIKKQFVEKSGLSDNQIWVTGYIGNDDLFKKRINALAFDLPIDKKVILYAPTFTPSMTSTEMLGDDLISLIRGARTDVSIIIKPHPNFCDQPSPVLERWRQMANMDTDVYLMDDPESDITAAIQASDLLISDASGVIFQYLTVDRPIVLLTNPQKTQDMAVYDAGAPEWAWRDVGEDLTRVQDLTEAVARALDDPRQNKDLRAKYRDLMFGAQTTGDAAQRIVENIAQLKSKN